MDATLRSFDHTFLFPYLKQCSTNCEPNDLCIAQRGCNFERMLILALEMSVTHRRARQTLRTNSQIEDRKISAHSGFTQRHISSRTPSSHVSIVVTHPHYLLSGHRITSRLDLLYLLRRLGSRRSCIHACVSNSPSNLSYQLRNIVLYSLAGG